MGINIEQRVVTAFGGLSVKEIAQTLGFNYQTFWKWVRGDREPPLAALIQISKTAKVSIDWLLTGEGPQLLTAPSEPIDILEILESRMREIAREEISKATKKSRPVITIGDDGERNEEAA